MPGSPLLPVKGRTGTGCSRGLYRWQLPTAAAASGQPNSWSLSCLKKFVRLWCKRGREGERERAKGFSPERLSSLYEVSTLDTHIFWTEHAHTPLPLLLEPGHLEWILLLCSLVLMAMVACHTRRSPREGILSVESRKPKLSKHPEAAFQSPSDSGNLNVQVIRFSINWKYSVLYKVVNARYPILKHSFQKFYCFPTFVCYKIACNSKFSVTFPYFLQKLIVILTYFGRKINILHTVAMLWFGVEKYPSFLI